MKRFEKKARQPVVGSRKRIGIGRLPIVCFKYPENPSSLIELERLRENRGRVLITIVKKYQINGFAATSTEQGLEVRILETVLRQAPV